VSNVAVLNPYTDRTAPLEICADALEGSSPEQILRWAIDRYADRLTFATGFGAEGCVLIDLIGRHRLPIDLFTLDTGVLFPETRALWQRLEARYHVKIRGVRPSPGGGDSLDPADRLWERDPDRCCALRKVVPLEAELRNVDAWISAIRRDQTPQRANAPVVGWDAKFGIAKVNPLVTWTSRDVWEYLLANDVPYNPLHDRGYPSIGCWPCTSGVRPGEDPRAGRWRGAAKTECGLHAPAAPLREAPAT
jgi:phosphoadenosine phosphosulfate reductase